MAKLFDKTLTGAMWVVGVIAALGIGGLFVAGGFMNVFLLKWLPLVVHQIVGWAIIVTTIIGVIAQLLKKVA